MRTILIAEDDYGVRQTLEGVLSDQPDWICSFHPDGLSLLIEAQTVKPHLVILDHNMTGISGLQVYRLLRERETTRNVPVLFLTALPERIHAANLEGSHGVLAKPFDIGVLVATIRHMLSTGLRDGLSSVTV